MNTKIKIALIIGNSLYDEIPLKNPGKDAHGIAQALTSVGFKVDIHFDIGRKKMIELIRDFGERLKNGKIGLFYFSGHGIQINDQNYLIPIGANIQKEHEIDDETVPLGRILGEMGEAKNNANIMILDACRNNPFLKKFRSLNRGLAPIDAPAGTLIAYATAPGQVAEDGEGDNSPYTRELIKQICFGGLKIEDVFKRVRVSVIKKTNGRQVPWESSSFTIDFYFKRLQSISSRARRLGIEFVNIPVGTFRMGDWIQRHMLEIYDKNAKPQQVVSLSAFRISKYEITNQQYCAFLNYLSNKEYSGFMPLQIEFKYKGYSKLRLVPKKGFKNHPVAWVTWDDAKTFAEWLGGRLPTEAEWEYTARACGKSIIYPWGKKFDQKNVNCNEIIGSTTPVGSYPPNELGLYDMAGNVYEWCQDWYGNYEKASFRDPTGPIDGTKRVVRGGNYWSDEESVRCFSRWCCEPNEKSAGIGFRVVLPS